MDAVGCWIRLSRSLTHDHSQRDIPDKLYRILRPDEDPNAIVAKNPNADKTVLSHVNCGSRRGYQSQYISTSASLDVAREYRNKAQEQGQAGLRIAEFDTNALQQQGCQFFDLTTDAGRDAHLGRAVMAKNFARKSQEIVLKCDSPISGTVIEG